MKVKIYGIKNCASVQKARKFIQSKGIKYEFIDFKTTPPSIEAIKQWSEIFGIESLLNTKGTTYKKLELGTQNLSQQDKLEYMQKHPSLIKRPIIEIYDAKDSIKSHLIGFDEAKYTAVFK